MIDTASAARRIRRIHFVEPGAPDIHIFSRFRLPRIGPILLATILRDAGYEAATFCEDMKGLNLDEIAGADLVGISTVTSTAPRAYWLADRLRERGVKVFMGGAHVTFMPDEALQHCDWVFRGEADEWITRAVEAIDGRLDPSQVRGLSWRDPDGGTHHNERPEFVRDLDSVPAPDFTLLRGGFTSGFVRTVVPVITSRGCPYDCSFCSVTPMFGRCYRFRSVDRVMDELRSRHIGGKHVFFYDDHFCANPKRTIELVDEIAKAKMNILWSAQVRADITRNPDLVERMARSGCEAVYIGMESINPRTLEEYNKKQTVEDLESAIKIFHEHRINMHGMFVLGADADDVETVRETADFALRNGVETVQFLILTPLPGTRYFDELRAAKRIIFDDWSLYDAQHVVFRPARMSVEELQLEMLKATLKFYSKWEAFKQFMRFKLKNSMIKAWARNHTKQWIRRNREFLARLQALGAAGAPLLSGV